MSTHAPLSHEDEVLSAELAFGLLDPGERAEAEDRLASDPAFAARHRYWEERAALMVDGPDERPSPSVWSALVARVSPSGNSTGGDERNGSLRFWRTATALASAAALVLAIVAAGRSVPEPQPEVPSRQRLEQASLIAVLSGENRSVLTINVASGSNRMTSAPWELNVGARSAELWVIPSDGRPRALGLIVTSAPDTVKARTENVWRIVPGATLAVSVEPQGGSPTGLPTGPVILTGKVNRV